MEQATLETTDAPVEIVQEDYFGTDVVHEFVLPDGVSRVMHQELNEGARRKYMNATNRDVRIARGTGDMHLRMAAGDDRVELLKVALVDWNLIKDGKPIRFTPQALNDFLQKASPKIVDLIEKDVRAKNPWLLAEVTVEDIDKQIAELEEMKAQKQREAEGKES